MPETTQPAEVFVTSLICKCGGNMKFTGRELNMVMPVKFEYQCEKCKFKELNETRYPFISYRPRAAVEINEKEFREQIRKIVKEEK